MLYVHGPAASSLLFNVPLVANNVSLHLYIMDDDTPYMVTRPLDLHWYGRLLHDRAVNKVNVSYVFLEQPTATRTIPVVVKQYMYWMIVALNLESNRTRGCWRMQIPSSTKCIILHQYVLWTRTALYWSNYWQLCWLNPSSQQIEPIYLWPIYTHDWTSPNTVLCKAELYYNRKWIWI